MTTITTERNKLIEIADEIDNMYPLLELVNVYDRLLADKVDNNVCGALLDLTYEKLKRNLIVVDNLITDVLSDN